MIKNEIVSTTTRCEMIEITDRVAGFIKESGIESGFCIVHVPHTTAAVTINENADPDVKNDMLSFLDKLIPQRAAFKHLEGNSDAHLKSAFLGTSQTVLIENGKPVLGKWQGIYFCEFDGPRKRNFIIKAFSS